MTFICERLPPHNAIGGSGLGHLFQRDAINQALDAAGCIFQEEWLFQIVVSGVLRRKTLRNICLVGHQNRGEIRSRGTALEFFNQLTAIHAGHAIVANEQVGDIIHGLKQSVGSVGGRRNPRQRRQRLLQHGQHHRVIVHQQQFEVIGHESGAAPLFPAAVISALASALALQHNFANLDALVGSLQHVVDGQRRNADGG